MPGIIGFTTNNLSVEVSRKSIIKMQNLIKHQEFHVKDNIFADKNVLATRTHTNIIQKEAQPFFESGIYIWLDGEFYNQTEIAENLDGEMKSDLHLLATLYRKNKNFSFLSKIDGIYSAVIYDSLNNQIHLISDRYGLRHLYWYRSGECFAWGSEVKSMLALPDFKPEINLQSVEHFFSIGYLLENNTWFEGVELLSPGTVLTWSIKDKSIKEQSYWSWDEIHPLQGKIDEKEIAEELGRLFVDAVKKRCKESEQVGLSLSGGLDSRAILAAMPENINPIHAMTFGKGNSRDMEIAKIVADISPSAIHHIVDLSSQNWLENRLKAVWWTDGQVNLIHMHGIKTWLKTRDYFSINLDGYLGGAILGGSYYPVNKFKNVFQR